MRNGRLPGEKSGRMPWAKRAFDVLLSGMGLLASAPLWGLIGLSVKLGDGGPVFYGQRRVGQGGRAFKSWKFRSMVPDAEQRFGLVQAGENDPRVTRVGRRLRAMALDELPQLWNIFKGDMSFVGPRALVPEEIEVHEKTFNVQRSTFKVQSARFTGHGSGVEGGNGAAVAMEQTPGYAARHQVRPGLTGLAQIYAPRDIPRRHKFKYDVLYIKKQSFWLDLKLIALSFWITFRGKWESRESKL